MSAQQTESITPPTPAASPATAEPQAPASTQPTTPTAEAKPTIEVRGGEAKELAERVKLRRELEAARKEASELKSKYEKLAPWEERLGKAKEKPLAFLREAGLSYDDVAQDLLRGGDASGPPPEPTPQELKLLELEKQLQEQKSWREAQEAERRAAEEARAQQAFTAYESKVKELLSDSATYGFALAGHGSPETVAEAVIAVRNQHWTNTVERDASGKITKRGEVLSEQEALDKVNEHWRGIFSRAPGAKPAVGQPTAAPQKQSVQPAQQSEPKPNPITNSLTPPATTPSDDKPRLSREELLQRSIDNLKAKRAAAKTQTAQH